MERRITGTTKLLGLIGSPVSHSGSPAMYNYSFERLGLDYAYLAFDIREEQAAEFIRSAKLLGMRGFNVTMPCKSVVAQQVDELSPAAKIIGAVNTVVIESGKLTGHITDGIGFLKNLEEHGVSIIGKKITLLGAGGAGLAVLVQAALDGAKEISVFNRRGKNYDRLLAVAERIREAGADCKVNVCDLQDEALMKKEILESDILINATSVGMKPDDDQSLITDMSVFHENLVVADLIYNPKETRLLIDAKMAGVKSTVGGKGMLLWQGVEAFKLYTGMEMPVQEVKELYFS